MSKLFKLKEWLSVPAAAEHLATVFQEDVAPSDVLRFALDGSLTLSVRFVNKCDALPGQLVPIEDAVYTLIPNPGGTELHRDYGGYVVDVNGIESHVLSFDGPLTKLQGVYDLPMMGGERLQVEHEYQRATDGSSVSELSVNGSYVRDADGQFFQLHQHFEDDVLTDGSAAQLLPLENFILDQDLGAVRADGLRTSYAAKRLAFLASRADTPGVADYSLLPFLPLDAELVVRTRALTDFIGSVDRAPTNDVGDASEIDPADLPSELDYANQAFRAVTNGHGDPTATFKNRLMNYLEKTHPTMSDEAVKRIATVANPDKSPGRQKNLPK